MSREQELWDRDRRRRALGMQAGDDRILPGEGIAPEFPRELPQCPCGQIHRFDNPMIQAALWRLLVQLGKRIRVTTPAGSWWVPRIYIAAHGLVAAQLPALAQQYGWERAA